MTTLPPGKYRIVTANGPPSGNQPAGWGLSSWRFKGDTIRDNCSQWTAVHTGDDWPMIWDVVPGTKKGTFKLLTTEHKDGHCPAGWGLSCWRFSNADGIRNDCSSRISVHKDKEWMMDWRIEPGRVSGTWVIKTAGHDAGKQPAGWGLSVWRFKNEKATIRNDHSSWVFAHTGTYWPMDWKFVPVETGPVDVKLGKYRIETAGHAASKQPAGWGLAAWRFGDKANHHNGYRDSTSTWIGVHTGNTWPMIWEIKKGSAAGTFKIVTTEHKPGNQPAGWGLSAFHFNAKDGVRNKDSVWASCHKDSGWQQDWKIVHGRVPGTYQIITTGNPKAGKTPADWGLACWRFSKADAARNDSSTMVACHSGKTWPMDWKLVPVNDATAEAAKAAKPALAPSTVKKTTESAKKAAECDDEKKEDEKKEEGNGRYFLSHKQSESAALALNFWFAMGGNNGAWLDVKNETGQSKEDMMQGIADCEYFMIILTPEYFDSNYCLSEVAYASQLGKKCYMVYNTDVVAKKEIGAMLGKATKKGVCIKDWPSAMPISTDITVFEAQCNKITNGKAKHKILEKDDGWSFKSIMRGH